jgi:hypothetical protein
MMRKPSMNVVQKIRVDGTTEDVSVKMTLPQLQAFVGGDIELVRCRLPHRALVVNENGISEGLAVNHAATALVAVDVAMLEGLRGNVLLVKA